MCNRRCSRARPRNSKRWSAGSARWRQRTSARPERSRETERRRLPRIPEPDHRSNQRPVPVCSQGSGHCHGGAMDDGSAKPAHDTEGDASSPEVNPVSLAMLKSRAQVGIDAPEVTIEVFLSGGLPSSSIVGLAETAVRESKERVRGAILNSRFKFPQERISVSLGPADLRKTGGRFDLAIALGILAAQRIVPQHDFNDYEFYGELGMNGE